MTYHEALNIVLDSASRALQAQGTSPAGTSAGNTTSSINAERRDALGRDRALLDAWMRPVARREAAMICLVHPWRCSGGFRCCFRPSHMCGGLNE